MPRWITDAEFFKYGKTCGQIRKAVSELNLERWTLNGFQSSVLKSIDKVARTADNLDDWEYVRRTPYGQCVWKNVHDGTRILR